MKNILFILCIALWGYTCKAQIIKEECITVYDSVRERKIPFAIYYDTSIPRGIVIFNHGYTKNYGGSYKSYKKLNKKIASLGYYVISIQHELPTDELLAMEGNLYLTRMPNWKRGVENISFIRKELMKLKPELPWNNLIIAGHSNGGDMTMLYAREYPEQITKAISLDNRRMPIPRTSKPEIYYLKAYDFPADEGVLPTPEEEKKFDIHIIKFPTIKHNGMGNQELVIECVENILK